ncbi:flagellar biosynthesis protein FlhB [Parvularcula flava]|uniref:Flagellar biosynthesis protein FlhB n=1 Tax=Aquisalinus luteolus TaxID=1566827 RepID=A0A8J3A3R2_9PROT|nr:flagellar type III secretion system protein FlhB [Aquisalinus luteolus]NHK26346.1 flagellar biosynthesis protein FlhB [Aquisalinus luteolus]GGH92055.1 flagellar biosynthesis protein FlhB [Aquisalinus luteolus]
MAEGQDEGQEKSFDATPHKIAEARKKGDVPQSREANTFMLYAGFAIMVMLVGASTATSLASRLTSFLAKPDAYAYELLFNPDKKLFADLMMTFGSLLAPVFVIPAAFIISSVVAQQSVVFATDKIKPKMSKINPISNAKQKYGPDGIGEFVKSGVKMLTVAVITGLYLWQQYFDLPGYSQLQAGLLPGELREQILMLLIYIIIASGAIAAVDLPWQRHRHAEKLKMTFEEVRKEQKEQEGDPHQKQERRKRAQMIATSTMLQDVKSADVVIVNPEHYAVALKWSRKKDSLPECVAKGVDELAQRIKENAAEAGVPIRSDPPTARSLYAGVEIGEVIQPDHYAAVAAAIHFADTMRKKMKARGR